MVDALSVIEWRIYFSMAGSNFFQFFQGLGNAEDESVYFEICLVVVDGAHWLVYLRSLSLSRHINDNVHNCVIKLSSLCHSLHYFQPQSVSDYSIYFSTDLAVALCFYSD